MPVITISSSFGSAGSVVARRVADRLGWKLLNRAITVEVASHLSVPLELAEAHDERAETGWHRLLENFAKFSGGIPDASVPLDVTSDEVRLKVGTEQVLRNAAAGNVVVVGRAAAIVLRDRDDALHVRLDGARQARIKQGAAALGLRLSEAEAKLDQTDRARAAYVKELYGLDWRDPALYHMVIDSTTVSLEACTDVIVVTAGRLFPATQPGGPSRFTTGRMPSK